MKKIYIDYITHSMRLSDKTVRNYNYILTKFDERLVTAGKSIDKPEEIKVADVYSFIGSLSQRGLSVGTCAWCTDGIKQYFRYCREVLELDVIEYRKIKTPKIPERKI